MASWVEKYRPENLDDIVGQDRHVQILKAYVKEEKNGAKELPHFLFSGKTGVGKTTAAIAVAKGIFGDKWNNHFTEFNASNNRGIEVVREKIKSMSKQSSMSDMYRILFLDEVDSMTEAAQRALRRIMEKYSEKTKFILSCNHPSNLLDAVRGRCDEFRFSPVPKEDIKDLLKELCEKEDLVYQEKALKKLSSGVNGNLRKAIQILQTLSKVGEIKIDWVEKELGVITENKMSKIFSLLQSDAPKKKNMKLIDETIMKMYYKGHSPRDILIAFYDFIRDHHPKMVRTLVKIGEVDARISNGANALLQLRSFMMWLMGKIGDE